VADHPSPTDDSGPSILFATSELYPLAKTGGLGDVSGALPAALRALGADCRTLIPAYPGAAESVDARPVVEDLWSFESGPVSRILAGVLPGTSVPVYLLDVPVLFERPGGPYQDEFGADWPDNPLRFGLLSKAAALIGAGLPGLGWQPDILHANDWQTGLAPAYLSASRPPRLATVFSVHNLAFQGNFASEWLPRLGLPWSGYTIEGLEFYGQLSFMKAGLNYSDRLTTVSPTYAAEIQTPEFGHGLDGLLRHRGDRLSGILNGIDTRAWNPAADPHIRTRYDTHTLDRKKDNRAALVERLGLVGDENRLILGMVSRMTQQKGTDLVLDALPQLLDRPVELAILGSGDAMLENRWRLWARQHPERVAVHIGYDEVLAHGIEAGADAFLMPSRFEPCGLNQMYSMHYGTPPIVRRTGGLSDSVVDATPANLAAGRATGVLFDAATPWAMLEAVDRTLALYAQRKVWGRLQASGMECDFSWLHSAAGYVALYRDLLSASANESQLSVV
jgi:starch synthase